MKKTMAAVVAVAVFSAATAGVASAQTKEALRKYEENRIHAVEVTTVDGMTGRTMIAPSLAYAQGKGAPLVGADLYEKAGRKDLAKSYRRRLAAKVSLSVTGGLLMLGGTVAALAGGGKWVAAGIGMGAAGVGLAGTGLAIGLHPVDAVAMRDMIESYNARLARSVGLASQPTEEAPAKVVIRISPMVAPNYGGVGVTVNY